MRNDSHIYQCFSHALLLLVAICTLGHGVEPRDTRFALLCVAVAKRVIPDQNVDTNDEYIKKTLKVFDHQIHQKLATDALGCRSTRNDMKFSGIDMESP